MVARWIFTVGLATLVGCEGLWVSKDLLDDYDQDGSPVSLDCNDFDASIHPAAVEVCDGIDNNCNLFVDDDDPLRVLAETDPIFFKDRDADGLGDAETSNQSCAIPDEHVENDQDCDDLDPDIGARSRWYPDDDADGFGDQENPGQESCQQPDDDWVANNGDCVDDDPGINPGVLEASCDTDAGPGAQDFNCDGLVGHVDHDGDGFAACEDCDDTDALIHPNLAGSDTGLQEGHIAIELCDGLDNDCNGLVDDEPADGLLWFADMDQDGLINPENTILCCDWYPNWFTHGEPDCDDFTDEVGGPTSWYLDNDTDGFGDDSDAGELSCDSLENRVSNATDCDDTNPSVHPGAEETCDNQVDENCDGITTSQDGDGDGHGSCEGDCDDNNADVNPSAAEICDGLDNDCNGLLDELETADEAQASSLGASSWYVDSDADGYGDTSFILYACSQPGGFSSNPADCNDNDSSVYPLAAEICDAQDNNCDGTLPDSETDSDGDGFVDCTRDPSVDEWADPTINGGGDCDDTSASTFVGAALFEAELCTIDTDQDGYGSDTVPPGVDPGSDCQDEDATIHPDALEVCDPNDTDEDCNGLADDDDAGVTNPTTRYADADADSYGDASDPGTLTCDAPSSTVTNNSDCNDADATQNVGPDTWHDGIDNDCDGSSGEVALPSGADLVILPSGTVQQADNWGQNVEVLGDLNDDGEPDFAITNPFDTSNMVAGKVYLYSGATSDQPYATLGGDNAYDLAGYSLADAGDMDNDGYADLVVVSAASVATGEFDILAGPIAAGDATLAQLSSLTLSSSDSNTTNLSAALLSGIGDVNSDGFDDVAVSVSTNTNIAFVIHGGSDLTQLASDVLDASHVALTGAQGFGGLVNVGDFKADGSSSVMVSHSQVSWGHLVHGPITTDMTLNDDSAVTEIFGDSASGSKLTHSIAGALDLDADGYSDLALGAPGMVDPSSSAITGGVCLVYGFANPPTGSGNNTITNQIWGCHPNFSNGFSTQVFSILGDSEDDTAGYSVSSPGDVNNDGFDDLIVGAPGASNEDGKVYLVHGSATRADLILGASAAATFSGQPASAGQAGFDTAAGADFNGDSWPDLLIGSADINEVYLLLGGP